MIISTIGAAVEAITGFNECVTFFQWLRSVQSCSNGTKKQELKEDDVLKLQSSLQCLRDTLPVIRDIIDRAEWKIHEKCVEELLPELKAAMYDAEDIIEDFRYYEMKVQIEGSVTSAEPGTKFFHDVIQENFKKLTHIKERLDNLSRLLKGKVLRQATPQFDRSVRPETTSFPTEAKIFGRDEKVKELIKLLGVPANNSRGPSTCKRPRSENAEATISSVPVLPIVGIGGVGKTTLVQNICSNPQVKRYFDVIVWICISNDFDVKRLTKEAIEQFSRKAPTKDNLNSLQADLADSFNKRRFLIVLDNIWAVNVDLWKMFCAPFKHVFQGSMMLVTTRSEMVADVVRTTDSFQLEGLKSDAFWKFFKLCVFGSNSSNNYPVLEQIGKKILPKLKGSPLAAKTLGRLLGMSLDPEHWKVIVNSQLWELTQEETDILPALRLSYKYLPFDLKRCFSFCAVYPKHYKFVKEDLAQIWMAEGFVESQQTGCKYFEELEHRSFFQKLGGKYVIHDLMHDMAQLVSKDECFIIKEKKDLERIPQKVRHLSVLNKRDVEWTDLLNLCMQRRLRTLLCYKSLNGNANNGVIDKWCTELLCMRVMICDSISMPDSISNMKNLRYLKMLNNCHFDSFPAAFCRLYNLQILYARKCRFEEVPRSFSNLTNLQKFELQFLKIDARLLKNLNLVTRELFINNLCKLNKDQAAEIEHMRMDCIFGLTLIWSEGTLDLLDPAEHNEIKVFEALHPPTSIKSVHLKCYPGEYLPSWFHDSHDPTIFSSLTEITIIDCPRLSSLEKFLHPAYMPAIKKMVIKDCTSLVSVPVERFRDLLSLEELEVWNCAKINSQHLLAPSLKKLDLDDSGNLGDDIDCSSLTTFNLSSCHLSSLTFNREKFPLLTKLDIVACRELEILNVGLPLLSSMWIISCPRLKWQNGMVLASSLRNLKLVNCGDYSAWFPRCLENLTFLESLELNTCKSIPYIPGNLWSSNLKSLKELEIRNCEDLVSIGGLEEIAHIPAVFIENCPKLKEVQPQPLTRWPKVK